MMPALSNRQRGFTLLELLVAVALLGLISTMLLGGVRFGTRVWERADAQVGRIGDSAARDSFLRRQFARMSALREDTALGRRVAFTGTRATLRFSGPAPSDAAVAGLYLFSLQLSDDGADDLGHAADGALRRHGRLCRRRGLGCSCRCLGRRLACGRLGGRCGLRRSSSGLVLSWALRDGGGYPGRLVVAHNVRRVELAYFGARIPGRVAAWQETWRDSESLPQLIRLRVIGEATGDAGAYEIVVAPRLAGALELGA